jgi:predicted metal-dependent enzyme (double-stranded beta helix superfamily)
MPKKNRANIDLPAIASRLADQPSLWQPLIEYDPVSRYYVRLAAEPGFEAWLLTWLPGQATDWHDHGGSAGAFVVLDGTLTEQHAVVSPYPSPRIAPGRRDLGAGALRAFGRRHVHRVAKEGDRAAISLHVYAPALVEMKRYEQVGGLLELADSQLVGVNW